jgi:hypothetical protein
MTYREESEWVIRFQVSAEFADDYEGELDGLLWRDRFRREVQPRILQALMRELQSLRGWKARPANRGLPADAEVLIELQLDEPTAPPLD